MATEPLTEREPRIPNRRIRKKDLVADETTLYYYNNNWQVLCEYNDSGAMQDLFVYGNYIDEVVFFYHASGPGFYYYVHDHLYSPAALVHYTSGSVVERYEYDAYGHCQILEPNFAPDPDGQSDYGNPYYFQGKRLDIMDNGGLELMSWPYRDYSTYLGRWLQAEKLGMMPNKTDINPFGPETQYKDALSLYEYVGSNPINHLDPMGLYTWEMKPSWFTKKFCNCLRPFPYFGTCGSRAIEEGWCNFVTPHCKLWCYTSDDVPSGKEDECHKKCIAEHKACFARGAMKKCIFKFKISG